MEKFFRENSGLLGELNANREKLLILLNQLTKAVTREEIMRLSEEIRVVCEANKPLIARSQHYQDIRFKANSSFLSFDPTDAQLN